MVELLELVTTIQPSNNIAMHQFNNGANPFTVSPLNASALNF